MCWYVLDCRMLVVLVVGMVAACMCVCVLCVLLLRVLYFGRNVRSGACVKQQK
jgi:hypothetical protein